MKHRIFSSIALCAILVVSAILLPREVWAQEYTMYETQYVRVMPGHGTALTEAMAAHNQQFHSEAPHFASVHYVVNGPRSGDLVWIMGPTTFTGLDSRPAGDAHDKDWYDNVLAHCEKAYNTEYWVLDEDLSYIAETTDEEPSPLLRVRFFEVTDNALFAEGQRQIMEVAKTLNPGRSRVMYQKRFMHRDGRDWAVVVPFDSWSELDEDGGSFQAAFEELYGQDALASFAEKFAEAVVSREDEWLQLLPELSGASGGN